MSHNGKKMLPEELDQIRKLVQKGESVATIAAKLCTSRSNIRNVIARNEDLGGELPEHYYRVQALVRGK